MKLKKTFFARDAATVAKELLGKILVHNINGRILAGKIVETEAYYGSKDPASRAFKGRTNLSAPMWGPPGTLLVYMVHNNWLLNVITGKKGEASAVLIRALEPVDGIKSMKRRRRTTNIKNIASGPGKLTKAMGITKKHNELDITKPRSEVSIVEGKKEGIKIGSSHRIGVSRDLKRKLRFFIKENRFVSIKHI